MQKQMKRLMIRVLPTPGGWKVKTRESLLGTYWWSDGWKKSDAVACAVDYAKAHEPSQVVIYKRDGTIQSERTYPRSSDPVKSKG